MYLKLKIEHMLQNPLTHAFNTNNEREESRDSSIALENMQER